GNVPASLIEFAVLAAGIPCSAKSDSLFRDFEFPVLYHANSGMKPQTSADNRRLSAQYAPPKNDDFPVNRSKTGNFPAERGSLHTASRTNQSHKVTDLGP
ncbi:MAG: hypothetical protein ACK439_02310, partial [Novosphingobium sp.]